MFKITRTSTTAHSPFLLSFALVLHVFPVSSVALGDRKQTNKQEAGKSGTDSDLCGLRSRGKVVTDSHSHFGSLALLRSQRAEVLVRATQLLHRAFGSHTVQLAHHQLVQVVGIREPCHQKAQTCRGEKEITSQRAAQFNIKEAVNRQTSSFIESAGDIQVLQQHHKSKAIRRKKK